MRATKKQRAAAPAVIVPVAAPDAPAAWAAYRRAWDGIAAQHLSQVPEQVQWDVRHTATVVAVHAYVCRLAMWGDVAKVEAAAQVWASVIKQVVTAKSKEAA